MYNLQYDLTRQHINDLQGQAKREKMAQEAQQTTDQPRLGVLSQWWQLRVARQQVRACRAELIRQEWEV